MLVMLEAFVDGFSLGLDASVEEFSFTLVASCTEVSYKLGVVFSESPYKLVVFCDEVSHKLVAFCEDLALSFEPTVSCERVSLALAAFFAFSLGLVSLTYPLDSFMLLPVKQLHGQELTSLCGPERCTPTERPWS